MTHIASTSQHSPFCKINTSAARAARSWTCEIRNLISTLDAGNPCMRCRLAAGGWRLPFHGAHCFLALLRLALLRMLHYPGVLQRLLRCQPLACIHDHELPLQTQFERISCGDYHCMQTFMRCSIQAKPGTTYRREGQSGCWDTWNPLLPNRALGAPQDPWHPRTHIPIHTL